MLSQLAFTKNRVHFINRRSPWRRPVNQVLVIILTRDLLFTKKLGLKLGFSRFWSFVIVGLQQMSAACCDVGYGEDAAFVRRVLPPGSRYKAKAVLFRILFSSMNCVQPFQFGIIYCCFEKATES